MAGVSQPHPTEELPGTDLPTFTPPKWISWLIALVPVFPPLYLAAFGCLGLLRTLPLNARYILFFFASTQLIAALFTPRPLLSLGLAAIRTLFILAMISAGVYLRDSRNLRPLLWGQLTIFVTAWGYTILTQGFNGIQARLGHPYYYVVSLGLVAVISLWFTFFWKKGNLLWRIPVGLFSLATFLATGSRGPLLALIAGSGIAVALSKKRFRLWFGMTFLVLMVALVALPSINTAFKPVNRLLTEGSTGRIEVWREAWNGWMVSRIGGVGPYQGGAYLPSLNKDGCVLTPSLVSSGYVCPVGLRRFSEAWLIAHNAWLHWLLESGLIGVSGLTVLYVAVMLAAFSSKDMFSIAVISGYTAMNMVDVLVAVPSQHITEFWWVIAGCAFYQKARHS